MTPVLYVNFTGRTQCRKYRIMDFYVIKNRLIGGNSNKVDRTFFFQQK